MRPIISTMTALAVILAAVPGVQAGKMPIVKIQPKQQIVKIKPPRIQVNRRLPKPARVMRKNDNPPVNDAEPQPDPPTRSVVSKFKPGQSPAIPPLPRPRPYNEFEEVDKGLGVEPETVLPDENKLFDEELAADLPGFWGSEMEDILNRGGHGALEGAFDNPPEKDDPFGFSGKSEGPELAGLNPDNPITQPGGPNDPNRRDQIPGFINGNPYGPKTDGGNQGMTNPSERIRDPRGMASSSGPPTNRERSEASSGESIADIHESGSIRIRTFAKRGDGSSVVFIEDRGADGKITSMTARVTTSEGGVHRTDYYDLNLDDVYVWTGSTSKPARNDFADPSDQPDPGNGGGNGPDSNPNPEGGWDNGVDVAMCGSTIPMWVCMRGASGSASPGEMLTQPSEDTGSIMGSSEGVNLGREAVTNTGDASWNTTDSRGNGGGGGGDTDDARQVDPPRNPDGG